ncbi:MAG: tRNA (adenosine(37)-N6)-threonylcarbamoyltransferase complex dimerization subunit type 1 TsaB [Treponema sp.]|nr:tRNA (adenosine(37)-N6)-threonylcarbamoyltransferase complex dimerization subunit type 1 TsaB [Treponema sp.]
MTTILALDTATTILSAALVSGDRYWYRETDSGLGHSELLMGLADSLLKGAGLEAGDLEAVACMKGPGSFTGLRIGFSAAKGIALALDIPLIACSTLDCLAYPWSPWPGLVIPVIDAKKERFFSALYRGGRRISAEMDAGAGVIGESILSYDELALLTGPEAPLFLNRLNQAENGALTRLPARIHLDPLYRKGRARELAAVAKETVIMNNGKGEVLSGPEYLRKSDAER